MDKPEFQVSPVTVSGSDACITIPRRSGLATG